MQLFWNFWKLLRLWKAIKRTVNAVKQDKNVSQVLNARIISMSFGGSILFYLNWNGLVLFKCNCNIYCSMCKSDECAVVKSSLKKTPASWMTSHSEWGLRKSVMSLWMSSKTRHENFTQIIIEQQVNWKTEFWKQQEWRQIKSSFLNTKKALFSTFAESLLCGLTKSNLSFTR